MAFVLIQHLDPNHGTFLREALAKATTMAISQPDDGTRVEPNHVYVIPPNADITIQRTMWRSPPEWPTSGARTCRSTCSFARWPWRIALTESHPAGFNKGAPLGS
jgi:chemotaxis response regulator CheB